MTSEFFLTYHSSLSLVFIQQLHLLNIVHHRPQPGGTTLRSKTLGVKAGLTGPVTLLKKQMGGLSRVVEAGFDTPFDSLPIQVDDVGKGLPLFSAVAEFTG